MEVDASNRVISSKTTPSGIGIYLNEAFGGVRVGLTSPCCDTEFIYTHISGPSMTCIGSSCSKSYSLGFRGIPAEKLGWDSLDFKQSLYWNEADLEDWHLRTVDLSIRNYIQCWTCIPSRNITVKFED